MSNKTEYRKERIERLLHELEYEIVRGMLDKEINEELQFTFIVPRSSTGGRNVVRCTFRTEPVPYYCLNEEDVRKATLRVVT